MSNVLLGTAIGDALGVAFETKLPNYQPLIDWDGKTFIGRGLDDLPPGHYSDDTMMSLVVAMSLIDSQGFNPSDLAQRYVELFTSNTIRGYGKTTLNAINNLIAGKHWSESGIAGSYGNGTAMRAAPFGVFFRHDIPALINACKIDSAMTHASEEAEAGSLAVALAAAHAVNGDTSDLLPKLLEVLPDSKVKIAIYSLDSLVPTPHITPDQALRLIGTKCDVRQTVPAAIYCYLRFNNYQDAVVAAIKAGGDTDTTAAIVGALFGAKHGLVGMDPGLIAAVENKDRLIELDSQLYNRSNASFLRGD
jgi:ADP-ribosylglycohydrolase